MRTKEDIKDFMTSGESFNKVEFEIAIQDIEDEKIKIGLLYFMIFSKNFIENNEGRKTIFGVDVDNVKSILGRLTIESNIDLDRAFIKDVVEYFKSEIASSMNITNLELNLEIITLIKNREKLNLPMDFSDVDSDSIDKIFSDILCRYNEKDKEGLVDFLIENEIYEIIKFIK